MPSVPVPEQVAKWRRWIHQDIRQDVVGMLFRRQIWLELSEMIAANPAVAKTRSSFWQFHHGNYAAAQAVAIRRQATEPRGDTSSLHRLLDEIARKPDLLTRQGYVALLDDGRADDELLVARTRANWSRWADPAGIRFDGAIARADARELERAGGRVKLWVDEHIAHDAAEPTVADPPTFAEIHDAVDAIAAMFQKYATVLTGRWWDLNAIVLDDWRAVFRLPWIES